MQNRRRAYKSAAIARKTRLTLPQTGQIDIIWAGAFYLKENGLPHATAEVLARPRAPNSHRL